MSFDHIAAYVWPLLAGFGMLIIVIIVFAALDRHPRRRDKRR